jgi:RNA polymerase sigma factor for flagellar operon FliA
VIGQIEATVAALDPTPGDEADLWTAWRNDSSAIAREQLVLLYLPYARGIAVRLYRNHRHHGGDFGDYTQAACIGLLEAIERYDPGRGATFKTYAVRRIEGEIHNTLQRQSDVSEQVSLRRRLQRERLVSLKGESRPPAGRNGQQMLADLTEIAVGLAIGLMLEETAMYQAEDRDPVADNAYGTTAWRQARDRVLSAVRLLPQRQSQVIVMHYFHGLAFDQIGTVLRLTRGRISQLHREALLTLRTHLGPADQFSLVR